MSFKEKLLNSTSFTRRTFLKGASVAGATAALYGCGGGGGGKTYMEEDTTVEVPKITERAVMGSTPHNCGGRCSSKYYIKDGVVKRIVTDENPDNNSLGTTANDPQRRSCVRCRSRKQWFYRQDRLLYPLKQTGNRGDVNGFVRISWEQAFTEIGQKLKSIVDTHGARSLHAIYGSGDSTGWAGASVGRLFNMLGGSLPYRDDYSWPALDHVATFTEGAGYIPEGNSRGDIVNAEHVFLWSYNGHEAIWGTQSGWYLTQAKERGIPMTAIDTRVSKTAATVADELVTLAPTTDAALILGMMHHLLTTRNVDLDVAFIKSHLHGFFDDPAATSYQASVAAGTYVVPNGASLSAYVMGNVQHAENGAASIYPNTIGYNVNTSGPMTDPLAGKRAPIYGQIPKTPEWASAITGVPAAKIREMADTLLDKKCTIWNGSGFQRHSESEQAVWLLRVLSVITKNFGAPGCSYGMQPWSWVSGPANGMGLSNPVSAAMTPVLYDATEMTTTAFYANDTKNTIPVFIWLDAVENGGTGTSRWNDGQVKALQKGIKCIFNFSGNVLANQSGDVNLSKSILSDKTKCELLVTCDHFMTSSAMMCDYVLPGTMQMEKPGASTGWFSEEVLCVPQVLEAPGEVRSEYDICAGIAGSLGLEAQYRDGKTMEDRLAAGWAAGVTAGRYNISYDEFKEKGIWKGNLPITIKYQSFRNNPAANPLSTPSGKFEAYAQWMMEDYQARHYNNIDPFGTLENGGLIRDAKRPAGSNAMRFVYPIPMYIPSVEGRHADGSHPDLTNREAAGYTYTLHTWHVMYRSHSTLNSVAYLNENFKQDIHGNPAFLPETRKAANNGAVKTWEDGVYEPVWINPIDASALGLTTGDRVLIENDRGKIYASTVVTNRVPAQVLCIGQGSWHSKEGGVDVGGCANTLTHARPSRICQGMTLANDCRVKITKA
ncbi:molybdopterin-dependent oxidoreductase [Seleniivibrio woodruffii]|uniref:Anaerobic dimethyl sulfoxide reductase subunit A n=1 Tax=Seleniivibrio woodruffii TaxID=1078050 RepID=A0A4R1KIM6_9BACT|nr:molybdopterin-dependent oxidoreductase [Seleniivibrio woodruffii]TCK63269.1 anaerobic dimethyl sulfoxide reductase subunit A [Seleniivibrio woodruffii]TVZ36873.1 anaerobic dimethyl sulfoxide reductase subunit A [Seleniivibrio woodruffii]